MTPRRVFIEGIIVGIFILDAWTNVAPKSAPVVWVVASLAWLVFFVPEHLRQIRQDWAAWRARHQGDTTDRKIS